MITKEFEISYTQVDQNNNLNVRYLFDYIMDVGNYHGELINFDNNDLKDLGYTWMLYQLKIDINRLPKGKEKMISKSWISKSDKLKSNREIEFVDENDNLLFKATCVWLVISLEKMRAVKIPEIIKEKFPVKNIKEEEKLSNLSKVSIDESGQEIRIFKSDIDYNKHVNSGVYLRWIVDSIEFENDKLKSIEIYFKDQTFLKDKFVEIRNESTDDGYLHQIIANGKDRVYGKTVWSKNEKN